MSTSVEPGLLVQIPTGFEGVQVRGQDSCRAKRQHLAGLILFDLRAMPGVRAQPAYIRHFARKRKVEYALALCRSASRSLSRSVSLSFSLSLSLSVYVCVSLSLSLSFCLSLCLSLSHRGGVDVVVAVRHDKRRQVLVTRDGLARGQRHAREPVRRACERERARGRA